MSVFITTILSVIIFIQSTDSFAAAAAVARRKQAMQHAQMQQEQAMQEAMVQQYQAAQQQAQAQQIAQYQAAQQQAVAQYQQQQMQAQVQQMLLQARQQQMQQVGQAVTQAQQQAMIAGIRAQQQQQIDYSNAQQAAMVASYVKQYQQVMMEEAIKQKMTLDAAQMAQYQQAIQAHAEAAAIQAMQTKNQAQTFAVGAAPLGFETVADEVDISDVWKKLDVDSRAWSLLIDNQAKVATVADFIDRFAKIGVKITKSPMEYVQIIDQMALQNPSLLKNPFKDLLQLAAIMEYDFDNGTDKDLLARKFLGSQLYEANKKRFTQK